MMIGWPILGTGWGCFLGALVGLRLALRDLRGRWIRAQVVPLDALDAELAEIDENLLRNELTVLERAEHFARRKQLYEAKYPAAVRPEGGRRRNSEWLARVMPEEPYTGANRTTRLHIVPVCERGCAMARTNTED